MTNLRLARRGVVTLLSAATLVLLASCVSGGTDLHDGTSGLSGGAPSTVSGSGGAPANSNGGSPAQGTTGGQLASGGSVSSTGGATSTTTGGVSDTTGGTSTSSSGGSGANGGSNSSTGGTASSCSDLPPNNGDTCTHAVEYGWCSQSWLGTSCQRSCNKCTGSTGTGGSSSTGGSGNGPTGGGSSTGGTASTTGGSSNVNQPPPITGGSQAWASRYWDCCKPACGWKANVRSGNPMPACNQQNQSLGGSYDTKNACEGGGSAYMCWSGAPWSVSDTLSYGFAAASAGNYVCGRCFQVQFTGTGHNSNNPGAQSLNGKTMIVQVINNGGVAADQFDILIPGGGVGALNVCSTQWGSSDLGSQYGGFLAGCNGDKNCVKQKCQTVFAGKTELLAGCDWFLGWFNAADNPNFVFKQIACPSAITQRSGLGDPG